MKKNITILFLLLALIQLNANPPRPDAGKRWVLNPEYSDEFNGTELDKTKWHDYHPTWKGREPGLFMPEMVKVQNGFLKLSGEKMDKDTVIPNWNGTSTYTFNIKCAAVISKAQTAHYGYYECRAKAAANTMSLTFWFSNRNNFDGPNSCNDKFSQEWDIHESIGREGSFSGSWFAKGMHSNAHYWYTDCDGERHDYRADEVRFEDDKLSSEQFDSYGGWWHDATSASYYYNNGEGKHQEFYTGVSNTPMAKPMGMNLVHETYPFPWISLPTDRELADTSINYALYDWVRAYVQVDADEASPYSDVPQLDLYDENVMFINSSMRMDASKELTIPFEYQCNEDRYISVKLTDAANNVVEDTTILAQRGYAHYLLGFHMTQVPTAGSYKIIAELKADESTGHIISSTQGSIILNESAAISGISDSPLNIYPNPVSSTLRVGGAGVDSAFEIYNLYGKQVMNGQITQNEIEVGKLKTGLYFLNVDGFSERFTKL